MAITKLYRNNWENLGTGFAELAEYAFQNDFPFALCDALLESGFETFSNIISTNWDIITGKLDGFQFYDIPNSTGIFYPRIVRKISNYEGFHRSLPKTVFQIVDFKTFEGLEMWIWPNKLVFPWTDPDSDNENLPEGNLIKFIIEEL